MHITKRKGDITEPSIVFNENIFFITIANISGYIKLYQPITIELL
jgi:hypothetical protein